MIVNLAQLNAGQTGVVVEFQGGYGLVRRMETMGIRIGKRVTKVSSMFMRGPVTIQVDNTQVALGFGMASKVIVRKENK